MKTGALISPSPVAEPVAPVLFLVETEAVSLNDWIERIRQAWTGNTGQTLALARLVYRARRNLPYGSWSRLWQSGQMPFSKRKGEMLVVIGEGVEGMDAQNSAHLSSAWNTLYYLVRLGRTMLERLIQAGRIHTGLTLREAKALLAEFHPEQGAKTPPSKLDARLRQFSAWVRAERRHWSLKEQELVRQRLLSLAGEIWTPADAVPVRPLKPLPEKSLQDNGRSSSIPRL
jgi:hypothetical protein